MLLRLALASTLALLLSFPGVSGEGFHCSEAQCARIEITVLALEPISDGPHAGWTRVTAVANGTGPSSGYATLSTHRDDGAGGTPLLAACGYEGAWCTTGRVTDDLPPGHCTELFGMTADHAGYAWTDRVLVCAGSAGLVYPFVVLSDTLNQVLA